MANIPLAPTALNLNLTQGFQNRFKAIPKNPDGTIYNATGVTSGNLVYSNTSANTPNASSVTPTLVTADATGIIFELTAAQVTSMYQAFYATSGVFTLNIVNGSDSGNACLGAYTIALNGL